MSQLARIEAALAQLPVFAYGFLEPGDLEFSSRVRWICENECPRYGKTWACPPGVGTVEACREKCLSYKNCLLIGTFAQPDGPYTMEKALATRPDHEEITDQVAQILKSVGAEPYVLSTEACCLCDRCAILDGRPCAHPDKMHPCVESHGINLIPVLEAQGLEFIRGDNVITWYSLLFFNL